MPIPFFCPVCDRRYEATKTQSAEAVVKKHVSEAHPDYDPEWAD